MGGSKHSAALHSNYIKSIKSRLSEAHKRRSGMKQCHVWICQDLHCCGTVVSPCQCACRHCMISMMRLGTAHQTASISRPAALIMPICHADIYWSGLPNGLKTGMWHGVNYDYLLQLPWPSDKKIYEVAWANMTHWGQVFPCEMSASEIYIIS